MNAPKERKRITEMDADELAAATVELDEEFVADRFGTPPAEAREQWERAKRGPAMPPGCPPSPAD